MSDSDHVQNLLKELEEMSGMKEEGPTVEEAILAEDMGQEEEVVEEAVEEAVEEEESEDDGQQELDLEEEEAEEVVAEEEETEEPVKISEVETLKSQLDELRKQNEQLLRSPQQPEQEPYPQSQAQQQAAQEYKELPFLEDDEDYEAAFSDRQAMNRLLSRVYYTAQQNFMQQAAMVVDQQITTAFRANIVRENFMRKNPEFEQATDVLGLMVNQVATEKPDLPMEQLLDEAANRLRKTGTVKTNKKAGRIQGQRPKGKNKPAFAKGTSSRPSGRGDKRTDLQRELDALQ